MEALFLSYLFPFWYSLRGLGWGDDTMNGCSENNCIFCNLFPGDGSCLCCFPSKRIWSCKTPFVVLLCRHHFMIEFPDGDKSITEIHGALYCKLVFYVEGRCGIG